QPREIRLRRGDASRLEQLRETLRPAKRVGPLQQVEQLLGLLRALELLAVAAGEQRQLAHLVRRAQPLAERFGLLLLERPGEEGETSGQAATQSVFWFGKYFQPRGIEHLKHALGVL